MDDLIFFFLTMSRASEQGIEFFKYSFSTRKARFSARKRSNSDNSLIFSACLLLLVVMCLARPLLVNKASAPLVSNLRCQVAIVPGLLISN